MDLKINYFSKKHHVDSFLDSSVPDQVTLPPSKADSGESHEYDLATIFRIFFTLCLFCCLLHDWLGVQVKRTHQT